MVWAREGELGRGGTLGAMLDDDWLPGSCVSGGGRGPLLEGLGLFWGPGDLLAPPLNRALLLKNKR